MNYTIKQLADLSGISTRALRYYDEINLFKPAIVGENQYRYYSKSQLIDLKQILFFKALGLSLNEIKEMLTGDSYSQIDLLVENRNKLTEKINQLEDLVKNCQSTIQHCRGNLIMTDNEQFSGFDAEKQQVYEDYLKAKGVSQQVIDNSWKKVSKHTKQQKESLHNKCKLITKGLADCINHQLAPNSDEVQALIDQHYQWVCEYWTPNRDTYKGLAEMYGDNNEFADFYKDYHPDMIPFLQSAMIHYSEKHLQ